MATGRQRPNFVVIMTDTQGVNVVGAYAEQEARRRGSAPTREELGTPRLDGLAAGGVTFERAYTTCPLCTPARAALFTGRYGHSVGAWANNLALAENAHHMGIRFRDIGYRTAYTGKWHLDGHDYHGNGECPEGWDDRYWFDGMRYQAELSDRDLEFWRHGARTPEALREHGVTPELTWGHRVADRAIGFMEEASRDAEKPFLVVASFDEPHGPFMCPPEYVERFQGFRYPVGPAAEDDLSGKPRYQRDWAATSKRRKGRGPGGEAGEEGIPDGTGKYTSHPPYFGCNSFVDSEIGRVIDAVDRLAPENTWIVFTSDHGDMLGAHQLQSKACAVYEEIAHIPLFIRPPRGAAGVASSGTRVSAPVSHIDVLPTLLELSGATIPPALEGKSLAPVLRGEKADEERAVVVEYHRFAAQGEANGGFNPMRAIVTRRHKLAVNLLDSDELYDLVADPTECRNLIDDSGMAELRDALHDRLIDWQQAVRDPFRGVAWERRPWRTRGLRLQHDGGWSGERLGRDDGYAAPFTQAEPMAVRRWKGGRA
ncbi:MAG TPA: sulfatase-like hydrolase/transferase [Chloroflexota bacterium]|nr:sulfatase-like hydrolase/transferase [Chloroflexota bacterium]